MRVTIYTDGACSGNPGPGGWAAILIHKSRRKELTGGYSLTTNQRMEIIAVIKALEALRLSCHVTIYSDSTYVVNTIQAWLILWERKDFKKVKNSDLWKKYLTLSKNHQVRAVWIKAHDGNPDNERCDQLAVASIHGNLSEDLEYVKITNSEK